MKLRDLITPAQGFQRSINLHYDLNDPNKILSYIPSETSEDIIGEILSSLEGRGNRASILVGSYGSGKSHLVAFLSSLLGRKVPMQVYATAIQRFKNPEVRSALERETHQDGRYLVVPITGGSGDLQSQLLRSMKISLSREGVSVRIRSAHTRALNAIERWRNEYPHTYQMLQGRVAGSQFESVDHLEQALGRFEPEALSYFSSIYTDLSAGASFDFFQDDAPRILEDVAYALSLPSQKCRGMFLVFDEFNRILEETGNESANLRVLQDLAEVSNRLGNGFRVYTLLISHKTIGQYTRESIGIASEEWLKIEGRFTIYDLTRRPNEKYELMSRVFTKNSPYWLDIIREAGVSLLDLDNTLASIFQSTLPDKSASEIEGLVHGCYPLHPILIHILPTISSRLAQNERTMFTFMASEGDSPVSSALERNLESSDYVYPYQLFDYFSVEMRRSSDQNLRDTWIKTASALQQFSGHKAATAILKTIGILSLVGNPAMRSIRLVRYATMPQLSQPEFDEALKRLLENRVIFWGTTDLLEVCEQVGLDLDTEISERMKAISLTPNYHLERFGIQHYVIPHRFNHQFKMTRYLNPLYVGIDGLEALLGNPDEYLKLGQDGLVVYVFPETASEVKECLRKSLLFINPRILITLPRKEVKIRNLMIRLEAIDDLQSSLAKTGLDGAQELLELYRRDAMQSLSMQIHVVTSPSSAVTYYSAGTLTADIQDDTELSDFVSKMMEAVYPKTPIMNNELINKSKPSLTSRRALRLIINDLIQGLNPLQTIRSSQEGFMLDTLFLNTGLWAVDMAGKESSDIAIEEIHRKVESYIVGAQTEPRNFVALVEEMMHPPYGLRKGVIPAFLAATLARHKESIRLENLDGHEVTLDADTIAKIVDSPSAFRFSLDEWDERYAHLVQGLASIFGVTLEGSCYHSHHFAQIGQAIFRWFVELPKISRASSMVSQGANSLRTIAKTVINNPRETILHLLPRSLGYGEYEVTQVDAILHAAYEAKQELDGLLDAKRIAIKEEIRNLANHLGLEGTVVEILNGVLECSVPSARVNAARLSGLIEYVRLFRGSDDDFIDGLAEMICGIRISDWSQTREQDLIGVLEEIAASSSDLEAPGLATQAEISYAEGTQCHTITIHKVGLGDTATLLESDLASTIHDYGGAVSIAEIKMVLFSILRSVVSR